MRAPGRLEAGGLLALEIGATQADAVQALPGRPAVHRHAYAAGPAGRPRVLLMEHPALPGQEVERNQ
jgi:hypothetical protein